MLKGSMKDYQNLKRANQALSGYFAVDINNKKGYET